MPNNDKKKKSNSLEQTKANEEIIELALNGITLLRADLIDEFRDSLKNHNKANFDLACEKAGIHKTIRDNLYKGLTDGFAPTEVDVWV